MNSSKIIWVAAAVIVVAIIGYWVAQQSATAPTTNTNGDEICAQVITHARNPVSGEIKEFPTPCDVPEGWEPVEGMIQLDNLESGQTVSSPLVITGSAPGPWYFEASFPVELRDSDGNLLATAVAQAQGEWMTTDLVPFSATVEFATGGAQSGTLTFRKDNPSGEPEHDAWYNVLVLFE